MVAKDTIATARAAAEKANAAAMQATQNLIAAQRERSKEVFADVLKTFKENVEHFGKAGRRQIRQLLDKWDEPAEEPARRMRKTRAKRAGKKVARRKATAPKYRLPTGETYGGKGPVPAAFKKWEASREGKTWKKAHEGERFPLSTFVGNG